MEELSISKGADSIGQESIQEDFSAVTQMV